MMEQYNLYPDSRGEPSKYATGAMGARVANERIVAAFHSGNNVRFFQACQLSGYVPKTRSEIQMYEGGLRSLAARREHQADLPDRHPKFSYERFEQKINSAGFDFHPDRKLDNIAWKRATLIHAGLTRLFVQGSSTPISIHQVSDARVGATFKNMYDTFQKKKKGKK